MIITGDSRDKLQELDRDSIDLLVTDPPYFLVNNTGSGFMGKEWDSVKGLCKYVPDGVDIKGKLKDNKYYLIENFYKVIFKECLRVLKPGAFAFVMSSPRQDVLYRMIQMLDEVGFVTGYTSIYWTYATGFPKAHNIGKSIDKRLGREREVLGRNKNSRENCDKSNTIYESGTVGKTAYDTVGDGEFEGAYGGFQPKPAVEIILVVQKPPKHKSQIDQALDNGKGVTWLDDCRIPHNGENFDNVKGRLIHKLNTQRDGESEKDWRERVEHSPGQQEALEKLKTQGRFPANLLVSDDVLDDGKEHPAGTFPKRRGETEFFGLDRKEDANPRRLKDKGTFSRFFSLDAWVERNLPFLIIPKASKKEKNAGVEKNGHPTVKPIQLMSYLITMGSRPGDVILDPFAGSGTTACACIMLGRDYIMIEQSEEYTEIMKARVDYYTQEYKVLLEAK